MKKMDRRTFIASLSTLAAAIPFGGATAMLPLSENNRFSFIFLGDIHFDRLHHHDMDYVRNEFSEGDVRQVLNYSRITEENLPHFMQVLKHQAAHLDAGFFLQLGDFLQGLCGSKELATIHAAEFIEFINEQELDRPFIVTKGNHDITGIGAREVYDEVIVPWQRNVLRGKNLYEPVQSANVSFVHENARFVLFDSYDGGVALDWLEKVLSQRTEDHLFFCIHPPVVPYNARSSWHVFNRDHTRREKLINLLGEHNAIVLNAHLHKHNIVCRNTPKGNFVQVAIGSVVSDWNSPVRDYMNGLEHYNANLVDLEPNHSPDTREQRMQILEDEKEHIRYYQYADVNGYGLINVRDDGDVEMSFFVNAEREPWTTKNLTQIMKG